MPASTERVCGGCTMCCKFVAIPELDKPCGIWCNLCDIGVGCREYAARPPSCRSFRCMWLADIHGVPEDFRPDKVKAVIIISNDEITPAVFCGRPPTKAFRRWLDIHSHTRRILLMNSRGMAAKLIVRGREIEVEGEMVDANTMRWNPKREKFK